MFNRRVTWTGHGLFALALVSLILLTGACGSVSAPSTSPSPVGRNAPASEPVVTGVGAIGITVGDLDRSVAFYTNVLGFEKISEVELGDTEQDRLRGLTGTRLRETRLRLGDETIHLTEYRSPRGRPVPPDSRSHDRWFQHIAIIVGDMDRAYARLRAHGVEHISPAPQRLPDWNLAAGGIRAFYFKDPDGHALEILEFPAGKGDPRWHRSTDRLFLGIDHTAIAVSDTTRSLAFYRNVLGLRIAGTSENWGPEQERLNNVPGAHLRITTLKAASGPGVELLAYVTPRDGPRLTSPRAHDLTHWEVALLATEARRAATALRASGASFVSGDVVSVKEPGGVPRDAVVVRDPDGHAVRLTSPSIR